MPDLEFFVGDWTIWEQDARKDHPVKRGQRFTIRGEEGDKVSFEFYERFGDGCWNHHIRNGRLENGHIRADVIDDGVCKPAPKTDTLMILEDPRKSGKKRIRCRVFTQQPLDEPVVLQAEEGGEFGAEDDG